MNRSPRIDPAEVQFTAIRVVLSIAGAGTDPFAAAGNGCEVVVWKAAS